MPLKLVPPRKGKSPNWAIRGTYLGRYVDRSSKTGNRTLAAKVLKGIERQIERGELTEPGEQTFAGAAAAYMKAGGEGPTSKSYWSILVTSPLEALANRRLMALRCRFIRTVALQLGTAPSTLLVLLCSVMRDMPSISDALKARGETKPPYGSGRNKRRPSSRKRRNSTQSSPRS